jgi:hypothetical protein
MSEEPLSGAEWISVFKLTALWQMDRLREIAINRISNYRMDTISWTDWVYLLDLSTKCQLSDGRELAIQKMSYRSELLGIKISLARQYKVRRWFQEGIRSLVDRSNYLSDEEVNQLGTMTAIKLFRIREIRYRTGNSGVKAIEDAFEAELKEMD